MPTSGSWIRRPSTSMKFMRSKTAISASCAVFPACSGPCRFFKGQPRAKAPDGKFRVGILLGLDDASLAGAPEPRRMVLGSIENLRDPDAVLIDIPGYH